ncbi:hypothetical protein EMQ25_08405 [Arsenicitalea aurantiaca]|uniref:Flagellar protein FlgJ N-terminal domain-containing protein n=1 Tax=Arsenicitalea aurantiaca TaxID=1783274 RepID=A0A433XGJ0_9HYPH|nr:rod-binding protein [Arsenicitalea aurantiaca]RUT33134.1 hypothetical protein EMQ25_08405 [Arsenicitalea aurantiaca]
MIEALTTRPAVDPAHARMRKQAEELEGVFLNTLVKEMFAGLDTEGAFGGGFAEDTWRGIQTEQIANAMAQAGGIGLADQIMSSLLQTQEHGQQSRPNPIGAYPR